jgi:hypothetical protein
VGGLTPPRGPPILGLTMRSVFVAAVLSALVISCGGGSGGGTGAPSGSSGGKAGGGSGGSAGPTTNARTFCVNELEQLCDLSFRCVAVADRDADFIATLGSSLAECKGTKTPAACSSATSDCSNYNSVYASACLMTLSNYTCDDLFLSGAPDECLRACDVTTPGTGGMSGTGGASGTGGISGTGGVSSSGGTRGTGGISGSGGTRGTGGISGSGGTRGTGGIGGSGGTRGTGGASQNPLCPPDYETNRDCPVAGVSCRIDCPSGFCGCTCQAVGGQMLWSCLIF